MGRLPLASSFTVFNAVYQGSSVPMGSTSVLSAGRDPQAALRHSRATSNVPRPAGHGHGHGHGFSLYRRKWWTTWYPEIYQTYP
ncbi:hypothetical protein EJ05DRAFT_305855 [Pseudovirgaria hyperparasitica]|uniref:Uncharacterized protein n=1 Tax=Pseudovirgaria hyperparasitica TaxID=470096 RepID=A0A6A6WC90_9PEZI|nr:uncharacterized protein EJ05DRAFT_305855 [Pseudovirgaria hyperparasitica]KAF2759664.1 hypothetical protein EJ05DRAFT_305855 [Pseudovirgaria hyperparasitica]